MQRLEKSTEVLVHRQRIYPLGSQLATLLVECRSHLSSCLEWLCNYGVNCVLKETVQK